MTPDPAALLDVAERAARAAGEVLLGFQRRRLEGDDVVVDTKASPADPVSEADRAAERAVVDVVLADRPDDGLVGEEDQADRPGTTGLRWVVDPLDGTVNFLHHVPQWCVSVAVEDEHGPLAGVVHHPDLDQTFTASRGRGAWLGERRLMVQPDVALDRVMLTTGFSHESVLRDAQLEAFGRWVREVRYVRRRGSAALDLAWIAAGRGHAYAEAGLHVWDWSAGTLLVTEAGGVVTHERVDHGRGVVRDTVVAASPGTHAAMVRMLHDRD